MSLHEKIRTQQPLHSRQSEKSITFRWASAHRWTGVRFLTYFQRGLIQAANGLGGAIEILTADRDERRNSSVARERLGDLKVIPSPEASIPPGSYTTSTLPPRTQRDREFLEEMREQALRIARMRENGELPPIQSETEEIKHIEFESSARKTLGFEKGSKRVLGFD